MNIFGKFPLILLSHKFSKISNVISQFLSQMCRSTSNKHKECNRNCHEGTCKLIQGQGPKCVCPSEFSGPNCESYRCSHHCKNHGFCYIDNSSQLRCYCSPQWTGTRCEKPVDPCENRCHNGGECTLPRAEVPQCQCKPGFTGLRCQNCQNLTCENGGVCNKVGNRESCTCPPGFKGQNCEVSLCGKFGKAVLSGEEWRCECQPGYTGERCDKKTCDLECLNGGVCRHKRGTDMVCICPRYFEGPRCDKRVCNVQCHNNGKCIVVRMQTVCQCPDEWAGYYCDVSFYAFIVTGIIYSFPDVSILSEDNVISPPFSPLCRMDKTFTSIFLNKPP